MVLLALVLSHQYNTYLDANKVQQIRDTWPGFEQEKGKSDIHITLSACLLAGEHDAEGETETKQKVYSFLSYTLI